MNKILNVAVTGYVGTGSSAVIDLLKEFDVCGIALGEDREYEHIPFYADNGLFDLGETLINVNSPLRSDTAISSFISRMDWLNNHNFGWFGSYKWLVGDKFEKAAKEFIEEISIPIEGVSYSHYKRVKFSLFKVLLQIAAKIVFKRPVTKWGRVFVFDKNQMYFSMPTQEEFSKAARKFVNAYFEMCANPKKQIMIYDHLIWPQQVHLINKYFGDNFKTIAVIRDARDLYNLNKNYWYKPPLGSGSPVFPTNTDDFVDYWKRVRKIEGANIDSQKVLFVHFEDLIYDYDQTVISIMKFLGLTASQHVHKKKYFDPERSIKNTQTFLIKEDWEKEANIIREQIPQYTYTFPYTIHTSISEMFDLPNSMQDSKEEANDSIEN
jgi:hypothetical protein